MAPFNIWQYPFPTLVAQLDCKNLTLIHLLFLSTLRIRRPRTATEPLHCATLHRTTRLGVAIDGATVLSALCNAGHTLGLKSTLPIQCGAHGFYWRHTTRRVWLGAQDHRGRLTEKPCPLPNDDGNRGRGDGCGKFAGHMRSRYMERQS